MLQHRPVHRGDALPAGAVVFILEQVAERAVLDEATQRLARAQARLDNLRKGRRPSELDALKAHADSLIARLDLAEREWSRRLDLSKRQVIADTELDQARSERDALQASVHAARAELATARLGAREDEIAAAQAEVLESQASLDRARWTLDQKTQHAPIDATVHRTLHEPGEFVPAGQPVVTLLPPSQLKVLFFVPPTDLPSLRPGSQVLIFRDGQPEPVPAWVTSVGSGPEFNPPFIFSRESRAKFVYRVEARIPPQAATPTLHPGEPVDVRSTSPSAHAPATPSPLP
jgi:HlyD family secretion protein